MKNQIWIVQDHNSMQVEIFSCRAKALKYAEQTYGIKPCGEPNGGYIVGSEDDEAAYIWPQTVNRKG